MIKERQMLSSARRIIIKIGTGVLATGTGRPMISRMRGLCREVAALKRDGKEVILVTSGAIAAGMEAVGLKKRPTSVPDLQMAAAVGQSRLMARYDKLFSAEHCLIGQVLLTHDDLRDRTRHLNARNTMMALLRRQIIPIINENDVVAVDELKFGDNDALASRVALLVEADVLILLSTTDGLRAPAGVRRTKRISYLEAVTQKALSLAVGKGSDLSVGGMAAKLQSAQVAVDGGTLVVIADGRKSRIVSKVLAGDDTGTLIGNADKAQDRAFTGKKRWIAFFHRPEGALTIDDGACKAIEKNGRSLLAIGIKAVQGEFPRGAVVGVKAESGLLIGHGIVEYSSAEIDRIRGKKTAQIAALLGSKDFDEVIHRDNMVVLPQRQL